MPTKKRQSGRFSRWRKPAVLATLLLIGCIAYVFWPRSANLRKFSPEQGAQAETLAWRHYYDQNYLQLGAALYGLCREQSGASPARSAQIMWHAVRAARIFQHSQDRTEAMLALPDLKKYYTAIARSSGEPIDIGKAARLELEWWQQRREKLPPEAYAQTIAESSATVYRVNNPDIIQAALLRAQAMAYRDARRNGRMTEEDWQHIEAELLLAWTHLYKGVNAATANTQ